MKKKILLIVVSLLSSTGMTYAMEEEKGTHYHLDCYEVRIEQTSNSYRLQGYFRSRGCSQVLVPSSNSIVLLDTSEVRTEEFQQKVEILTDGFNLYPNEKKELEACESLDELLEKVKEYHSFYPV